MKTLNETQLVELLANNKGAMIVGLVTLTDARARKTNNPYGKIYKQVVSTALVGADYEVAVLNEGLRQTDNLIDFKSGKLPYGTWIIPNKVLLAESGLQLRTTNTPNQRKRKQAKVIGWFAENGTRLNYADIKQFLPEKRESAKQQESGLNETVFVRNYKFASILKIRYAGVTYRVKNFLTDTAKALYDSVSNLPEVRPEVIG